MNITHLRRLLASPVFEGDDEKTRVAGLINTIAISALALDIPVLIILPIAQPGQSEPLYLMGIAITLLLGILFAIRKGWVRQAGNFLAYGFWLLTTLAVATSGGTHAPAFGTYTLSVLIAGLLLGWRAVVSVGALSVLAAIAMVLAEQNGVLPAPSFPITTEGFLIAQIVSIVLSGILLGLAIRSIERAFTRARLELKQRIETEKQLQQAEARYRDLVERVPAVIYSAEPGGDGRWLYVSPRIESLTGYTAEEWASDPHLWYARMHPQDRGGVIEGEARALQAGLKFEAEYRLYRRDGRLIWLRDESLQAVHDSDPEKTLVKGFLLDVTDRKDAEAEREVLIAELTAKNAELERFTYTVSHDLKSPLVTIKGFLGYLEQDAMTGNVERLKGDTQRISNAVEKMQELLNDLLELSRIGRFVNPLEVVSFDELARLAIELVEGRIQERGVTVELQPGLPAVYGDRQRLTEVLQNLIDNAAKYMGDQAEPRIEIGRCGEEDGKTLFYVKDNGLGIAPEYRERVFGLFNKLDPRSEGTGIGLALVRRIIEFHGGRIWVESEAGKGSAFCFTLGAGPLSA